jgi:hypothetical protein
VDIVVEADVGATLDTYKLIVIADTHVSTTASAALAAWVEAGGVLVATAGAGMFNEFNASNTALRKVLGAAPLAMVEPAGSAIQYIKQDLAFAEPLGRATWTTTGGTPVAATVSGARHEFTPAAGTAVIATFDDGAPAALSSVVGKGRADYFGWLPGLSYFMPAIPRRPADRAATDAGFNHFVPSAFDAAVLDLVTSALPPGYERQVSSSNNLVHGRAVVAKSGVAVVLVNWSGADAVVGLNVTVRVPAVKALGAALTATMASGGAVNIHRPTAAGWPVFTVAQLDVADALILR